MGDRVVQSGIQKKIAEMSYGLNGKIPDGMLVRVSSIDANAAHAYEMQTRFADQMLRALKPEYRSRLDGSPQPN